MVKDLCTWKEVNTAIDVLASFAEGRDIKYITGPPRGGLIPAVMLSHTTGIPYKNIDEIVSSSLSNFNEQILVVDDIYDSGHTLTYYKNLGFTVISLFKRISTDHNPDFYVYPLQENLYIIFPWENRNSELKADYLKIKNEL